jgi:hypothetical protein
MPPRTDLKRRGEVVELLFLYRAAALGLTVCKPYGDSAKYDFLVDASGHFTRVQVRSVSILQHSAYRISCGSGAGKKPYTPDDIDLLAAYIVPEDAWYLIPVSAFAPAIGIRLHPGSRRRFERFRDAWHLLWNAALKRRTACRNLPLTAPCPSASPGPTRLLDA